MTARSGSTTAWAKLCALALLLGVPVSGVAQDSPHWKVTGSGRAFYSVTLDPEVSYEGQRSLRLTALPDAPDTTWGASEGVIDIRPLAGGFLRIVAFMKTDEAGSAALWARVDGERDGSYVNWSADTMADREVEGSTDWTEYELRIAAPQGATMLLVGTILRGGGTVWIDQVEIAPLGADTQPSGGRTTPIFHDVPYGEPAHMQAPRSRVDFEDGSPDGSPTRETRH